MKTFLALFLAGAVLLSSCALPQSPTPSAPTQSNDAVATEVSKLLTAAPSPTGQPIVVTPPVVTETIPVSESPTSEPTPTTTPTDIILPTETPTATSVPVTAAPTNTPPAGDPKARLGNPTYRDAMDTDRNWPTDTDTFSSLGAKDGYIVMTAMSDIDGWRMTWPEVQDYYLEMTVKTGTCSGSDHFGVIFRVPDKKVADRGYLFGLTCDGRYSLREWDGKTMTNLVRWTSSPAILSGSNQVNRLGVMAIGKRIILYANGTLLGEVQDDTYTAKGGLGIFIGSDETDNLVINIDELAYWENPSP